MPMFHQKRNVKKEQLFLKNENPEIEKYNNWNEKLTWNFQE